MGFLNPDPQTSYVESVGAGVAELVRLCLPGPAPEGPLRLQPGSRGGDPVPAPVARRPPPRDLPGGHDRLTRPGSRTHAVRHQPDGAGISGFFTPEWARDGTYDFILDGDWYPIARGLMPTLYDVLTRMGNLPGIRPVPVSVPADAAGRHPAGRRRWPARHRDDPGATAAARLAARGRAQGRGDQHPRALPANAGVHNRTAVDHCAASTAQKVTSPETVVAYTVPGTWASWNDGPPAWTAWQLP
jgi:hypothetical protein